MKVEEMEMAWSFDVEREGEEAYVIERQRGAPGCIKHGPMPRDFAGPFIDERKEALAAAVERAATAIRAQGRQMLGKNFNTPSNSEWRPVMSPFGGLDTSSPYDHDRVEIRRGHNGEISAVDFRKLSPTFNVADLYWRPIAR